MFSHTPKLLFREPHVTIIPEKFKHNKLSLLIESQVDRKSWLLQDSFTAQTYSKFSYWLVVTLFETPTKMNYGRDNDRGNPLQVRLNGYGDYVSQDVP